MPWLSGYTVITPHPFVELEIVLTYVVGYSDTTVLYMLSLQSVFVVGEGHGR